MSTARTSTRRRRSTPVAVAPLGEGQDDARLRGDPGAVRRRRDGEVRPGRPEGDRGPHRAALQDHRDRAAARPRLPAGGASSCTVRVGDRVEVVPDRFPDAKTTGEIQFISPTVDAGERDLPGRRARPARAGASRCCAPAMAVKVRFPAPAAARRLRRDGRWRRDRRRSTARLRSALDRVLVHDVKNMSFRLRLLLSNLDEHWEDPEFRKTVRDLLASTVERLEDIVGRFIEREDAAADQGRARRQRAAPGGRRASPTRRGARGASGDGPSVSLALGAVPRDLGRPVLPGRRLRQSSRERVGGGRSRGQGPRSELPRAARPGGRERSSRSSTMAPG